MSTAGSSRNHSLQLTIPTLHGCRDTSEPQRMAGRRVEHAFFKPGVTGILRSNAALVKENRN